MKNKIRSTLLSLKTKNETKAELYERLSILRPKIAREENVRAFRIFSHRTLKEICQARPKNKEELFGVKGVGPQKLEAYATRFLRAINTKS